MTLRVKTVEYAFAPSIASVASATARNFTQLAALYIPETTSRTFRSVILEVSCVENGAAAASATAVLMGVALGAVAIDTATVTQTIVNSGENQAFLFTRDVTAYFVTNYTGTTMTADCRLTMTGVVTQNAYAKLIITYEYDDAATTQLKTVRIPIDGNIGALTTGFTTIGAANQIPLLDEFLPEGGKTIRSYFFQMDVHTGTTAAATSALTMRYDGATSVVDTSFAYSLNSDCAVRRIDNLIALSTNATHSIEALVTSVTGSPFNCINGVLVITYSFTPFNNTTLNGAITNVATSVVVTSTTGWPAAPFTIQIENEKLRVTNVAGTTLTVTRGFNGTTGASHADTTAVLATILNSCILTAVDEAGWSGGTATGDKGRFARTVLITEPGLIQLGQSGVLLTCNDAGAISMDLRVGGQASRVYAHPATARSGMVSHMRRIDAGSVGGTAGMTLVRGHNDFVVDYFTTSGTAGSIGSNVSGLAFLNYTSGQSAFGGGDHNHTTTWMLLPYATGGLVQKKVQAAASTKTPIIPEADYYLMAVSYVLLCQTSGTAAGNLALVFNTETQAAEAEGAGWRELYSALFATDAEIGFTISYARGRTEFKRWPGDPDPDRLNVETARDYRFDTNVTASLIWQSYLMLTHNSITFNKTIAVTGSAGGTVTVNVRRAAGEDKEGMLLWTGTRSGDGNVTAVLFEDTSIKFTETRETDALVGRSGNWT